MTAFALLKLKIQMKKQRWYNIKRFHLLRLHLYAFRLYILQHGRPQFLPVFNDDLRRVKLKKKTVRPQKVSV